MIDKYILKNKLEQVVEDPDFIYTWNEVGEKSINQVSVLTLAILLLNENVHSILELLEEKFA